MGDTLKTIIYGRARFDSQAKARAILEYLLDAGPFTPERFGAIPPCKRRFSSESLPQAATLLVNRSASEDYPDPAICSIWMERRSRPKAQHYHVEWIRGPGPPFSQSSYRIEASYVKAEQHLSAWLEFCLGLLELHKAWFAAFCLDDEWDSNHVFEIRSQPTATHPQGYTVRKSAGSALHHAIPGIYWGTYIGSYYVDWLGRERFRDLPWVEKYDLAHGGIFFTTAEKPEQWNTPECQTRQRAAREALGADAFFDTRSVREQVAALPPGCNSNPSRATRSHSASPAAG